MHRGNGAFSWNEWSGGAGHVNDRGWGLDPNRDGTCKSYTNLLGSRASPSALHCGMSAFAHTPKSKGKVLTLSDMVVAWSQRMEWVMVRS